MVSDDRRTQCVKLPSFRQVADTAPARCSGRGLSFFGIRFSIHTSASAERGTSIGSPPIAVVPAAAAAPASADPITAVYDVHVQQRGIYVPGGVLFAAFDQRFASTSRLRPKSRPLP